ncbi:MAG: DivIVA domain-containing protein [Mycoplasmataceae bacterium]|jgi:DivIVA domain-containing protein|nr:DivIVA domain-containing protein [Mycoplasmataceae bacterium]
MPNKIEVMMNEILNKKFSKRIHSGYDPEDVDKFFDYVIAYLREVNGSFNNLQDEFRVMKNEIRSLDEQLKQKNNTIVTLNGQIEYYRVNGYDNQRVSNEMATLRSEIVKLKNEKTNK